MPDRVSQPPKRRDALDVKRPRHHAISVFGLGLVGLVTAVCIAKKGYRVFGIEPDDYRARKIRSAESPYFEPGLSEYLKEVMKDGTLTVTDDSSPSSQSDIVYVTVGTSGNDDGRIDLTCVRNAASAIGREQRDTAHYQLVIIKSTVTPGTATRVVMPIISRESGKVPGRGFGLVSNPEFLREGSAIRDTEFPDRIIIGTADSKAGGRLERFYKEVYGVNTPPTIRTTHENAELIKYANNAFLAMKVSFINSIANIAERTPNADIETIANGIGLDERIGLSFLRAGFGWGGSCLPKDLRALLAYSKDLGYNLDLIEATISTNERQRQLAVQLVGKALGGPLRGRKVAILGLAFKPETDDMREAVSVSIVKSLIAEGATVVAYDPVAMDTARAIFEDKIEYAKNSIECISQADCCLVATEWEEFKAIPPRVFVKHMRNPNVIDGRRIYNVSEFVRAGVRLLAVGLGPLEQNAAGRTQDQDVKI